MKRVWKHIRVWMSRAMDFLGRFRLLTLCLTIFFISVVLFGLSLFLSNRIAKGLIRTDYQDYNEAIFTQMETELNRRIDDLTRLCYSFMSNKTLVEFLEDNSFDGRTRRMDAVNAEFDRMIAIQEDIRAISLHQLSGKILASTGLKNYFYGDFQALDGIRYSGPIRVESTDYFAVTLPVFNVDTSRHASKIGYCHLLVNMDFLTKSLSQVLPGQDYYFMIADAEGHVILERGDPPQALLPAEADAPDRLSEADGQLLYRAALPRADWHMLFGVPQKQLYANINLLQHNYDVTYIIIGLLLLLLFAVIYSSVLRPIHSQIRFMNYYARSRNSRMEVVSNNEMGELASHLNQMLDDIDQLTAENLAAQNRILEAEYQKKQSELLAYRNQINPHFLHNTFECIRGMALYYQVEDIAVITESLSNLFSYNLRGKGYAAIRDINAHLDNYTSIIRYRFNSRFAIEKDIDPQAEEVLFPKMVIQPLVENAIFHGLETVETGGTVRVTVQKSGETLCVSVSDNGIGMSAEELAALRDSLLEYDRTNDFPNRKHGIGLLNIYRRLRLFYGERLDFAVDSAPNQGTSVTIRVPCEARDMEEKNVPGFFD